VADHRTHLIGLLLGTEDDWPTAFEQFVRRLNPQVARHGQTHGVTTKRVTIEPFSLRATARHAVVLDRLAYWYDHPREWLKKVALMDGVYLLNNPFTFQSMENCKPTFSRPRNSWSGASQADRRGSRRGRPAW